MLYKNASFVREGIRAFPDFFMTFSLMKTLFSIASLVLFWYNFIVPLKRGSITKTALGGAQRGG